MGTLKAGASRANITPPVGTNMAGFAGRDHGAVGIHDELWSKVLYLSDDTTEVAIVTNDIIGLGAEAVAEARKLAAEQAKVPAENIFISCSHTHSGPVTGFSASSPEYMRLMLQKIAGAIFEAKHNARSASIGWGRTDVQVGVNRREKTPDGRIILGVNPDGAVAPYVDVIRVDEKETGKPISLAFCHAAHPVVMGPDNYYLSADFPGYAQSFLEYNTGAIAMFMNGCCGNINAHPRGTFDIARMLGTRLGSAALKAYTEIGEMASDVPLSCAQNHFSLPVEDVPSVEECERQLEEAKAALEAAEKQDSYESRRWSVPSAKWGISRAEARLEVAKSGEKDIALPVECQAIKIGDLALVSLPGEIFVEIGLEISKRSDFKRTLAIGNANGSIGYVPIEDEIPKGGYEVTSAIARYKGLTIRPDTDKKLIAGALEALRKIG